jgi:hypothetical protein
MSSCVCSCKMSTTSFHYIYLLLTLILQISFLIKGEINLFIIYIYISLLSLKNKSGLKRPSWQWIYNYLCNQCLSPLMLLVRIPLRARCTTLCDKVCQWLATGQWFSLGPPVSSTNKTDHHDITEILLKVTLNTIKPNYISCM